MVRNVPLRLRGAMSGYAMHQACRTLSLGQMPNIDDIAENIDKHMAIPEERTAFLVIVGDDPVLKPIAARRWNILLIEAPCNRPISEPFGAPLKYLLDDRCGFGVYNQVVFVGRVLRIAVRGITANILSILSLGL